MYRIKQYLNPGINNVFFFLNNLFFGFLKTFQKTRLWYVHMCVCGLIMNFCLCLQCGLEHVFPFPLAYCANKYTSTLKKKCSENCYILTFVTELCLLEVCMWCHIICDDRPCTIKGKRTRTA